jgi:membrane protein implicated in regulation of membrane protease activity
MFHAVLPFAAYATLAVSALAFRWHLHGTLFAVATAALLLLFVGIHNAWDGVTYHIFVVKRREQQD